MSSVAVMNLLDFWQRDNLDEQALWTHWDRYYRIVLLQFALNNNVRPRLWLHNLLFNFRIQVRRLFHLAAGQLPSTLDEWLKYCDEQYGHWSSSGCQPATAPSVTLIGDIAGRLTDPLHFPSDSAVYSAWRGLAEAVLVIDKRLGDLETERRTVLLESYRLMAHIDHLTKLAFIQDRVASAFERSVAPINQATE